MKRLLFYLMTFAVGALTAPLATAQFYNNGTFYVGTSGVLFINSSYTNSAAADYQNNGTVYITGNLVNSQASMPAGTGRTYFNGLSAQTLSGTQPFRNLNINIDNESGLILANRLSIGDTTSGLLTFTAGTITTGTSTEDVYFYPGSAYSGYDSLRGVIGYVTKSGNTDFDFPLITGTHPADLLLTSLTGDADFQVLYTGSGYGQYNTDGSLVPGGVFGGEWWNVARNAGTAAAEVTLKWDDARKPMMHTDPGNLVVAHFTGGSWTNAGGTSTSPANSGVGTVGPSNSLSSFSPFTFGSTGVPLPIILSSFTVTDENCKAYLTWTTSLEQNAVSFDIEQSTDAISFNTVGNVRANDAPSTYHATVAQATQQAYYRLRLNNLDGSVVYSNVDELTLSCLTGADHLSIYPNPLPAGGMAMVNLTTSVNRGLVNLQVYDGQGRKVYSAMVSVTSGLNQFNIPASGLAQGIYSVILVGSDWKSEVIQLSRE
jgi:Secretion system C-terminal sorting domain